MWRPFPALFVWCLSTPTPVGTLTPLVGAWSHLPFLVISSLTTPLCFEFLLWSFTCVYTWKGSSLSSYQHWDGWEAYSLCYVWIHVGNPLMSRGGFIVGRFPAIQINMIAAYDDLLLSSTELGPNPFSSSSVFVCQGILEDMFVGYNGVLSSIHWPCFSFPVWLLCCQHWNSFLNIWGCVAGVVWEYVPVKRGFPFQCMCQHIVDHFHMPCEHCILIGLCGSVA